MLAPQADPISGWPITTAVGLAPGAVSDLKVSVEGLEGLLPCANGLKASIAIMEN